MTNKIVLGTAQFGIPYGINNNKLVSDKEFNLLMHYAKKNNILYLDTAPSYGISEKRIGHFCELNNVEFNIHTKFDLKNFSSPLKSLVNSLFNLKIKKVDTIYFHSFKDYYDNRFKLNEILDFKGTKFKKLGVSVYENQELSELEKDPNIDVVQCPFNLLDNHNLRSLNLKKLKKSNKIINCRSVFLQGLFFKKFNKKNIIYSKLKDELNKLYELSKDYNIPISRLALLYPFNFSYIDNILLGVDNVSQLKNNLNDLNLVLKNEIIDEINNISTTNKDFLNPLIWLKYDKENIF